MPRRWQLRAVILAGAHALSALETYYAADLSNEWGAAGIAAAAVDHLRRIHQVDSRIPPPGENAVQAVHPADAGCGGSPPYDLTQPGRGALCSQKVC